MRTSLLAFVALAVSVSLSATAASQEAGAVSTAAGVELPVDARELLASASQVSLAADTDTLVVRLTAMRAADTTTAKTDAQLREQAQILFKLYKVLNPKAVAAMGKTETEQFETFYKTVFQQILARVESDKTSSGTTTTTTSAPGTSPGTTPSTGSGSTPGATPSTSSGTTPATGTTSAPSPGSTTTPGSTATPGSVSTARYSAVTTTDPTQIAESLSFFSQVYDPALAQNVRALQDNSNNLEAIVQSTKTTSSSDPGSDPANQFQAPTVLDGVDEGPTTLDGRRLANATNETYGNVQLLFCDVGGNAIWKWKHTPYTDDPINTTTQVNIFTPKKVCEAPQLLEVKVTAYQSGCSRQNHPEGCDNVYWKGCGGLTVNPNSDRIVVARTGGRSLGLLYYKKKGDQCQGRVVDAIKTYKGKKFNSISYAEYAPSGNLYFTDSPFGLAKGPEDYEGDILDKSPLRELPFNGVFLLKNTSKKVELIECAMDRPNKIAFSPKGDVMYITNSRKGNSYVKQFNLTANGEVRKSSLFFNFTAHPELDTDKGYADGIKTDSEGNVYVAAYKGIYIFSPKGDLIGNLRSNQEVSGIALGGGRLFLTGAFGVVAQSTGIKPAATLPFAKTDCAA